MKGILFGGCSFTWGQGLYFYSDLPKLNNPKNLFIFSNHTITAAQIRFKNTLYYPRLVANYFNTFEVVRDLNGGCEDETFDFFKRLFQHNKNIISPPNDGKYEYDDFDYIIIQLSAITRNKFYFNIDGQEFYTWLIDENPRLLEYMKINNYTFDNCYSEFLDQQFKRLKKELMFYESKGIKIKLILWFDDLLNYIQADDFFINKLISLNYDNKKFNTVLELADNYNNMYIINDSYFTDKKINDYHPSKLLHQIIADNVIKSIESDVK